MSKKGIKKREIRKAKHTGPSQSIDSNRYSNKLSEFKDVESPSSDYGGNRTSSIDILRGGTSDASVSASSITAFRLNDQNLSNLSVANLQNTLVRAHPDVSFAVWNYLRLGNTDLNIRVFKLNGNPWPQAEKDLELLVRKWEFPSIEGYSKSRSIKKIINQLLQSAVVRGAVALEAVLTDGDDDIQFLAPVDPASITFEIKGGRYVPTQDNKRVSLDIPTFFYEGVDEYVGQPYGRSPIMPALSIIVFQMQVLNDLKMVIHKHGFPKDDIVVLQEAIEKRMPMNIKMNEVAKKKFYQEQLSVIKDAYEGMEVDDSFVHYDSVTVNQGSGKVSGGGGGQIVDLRVVIDAIDNLIMTGLKTHSTVLGRRSQGNTESFAKLEIKLYQRSVQAFQELIAGVLSKVFMLALNLYGKQGIVEVKFDEVDIRTMLEKAQFEGVHMANIVRKRDEGWIDNDMAAQMGANQKSAITEPRSWMTTTGGSDESGDSTKKKEDNPGGQPDEKSGQSV